MKGYVTKLCDIDSIGIPDEMLEVHINKELVQRLLSYGSDVTVLGPETLKQKMKEEIQKMADNY